MLHKIYLQKIIKIFLKINILHFLKNSKIQNYFYFI